MDINLPEIEDIEFFDTDDTKKKEKINFKEKFKENKTIVYTIIYYSLGLFIGAYFYKLSSSETIDNLLKPTENSLLSLFISDFCIYFSIYVVVVFLGFCLIGYPILNIIPAVIGIVTGIKMSYWFINYSAKGIGYSLIMIVPYVALFLTVLAFAIKLSYELSKELLNISKGENNAKIILKPYMKKYLKLALCVVITALIDSSLTSLLITVVTI
jgi:hypothetical protein